MVIYIIYSLGYLGSSNIIEEKAQVVLLQTLVVLLHIIDAPPLGV